MTHLPFIVGAYAVTITAFLALAVSAAYRLRTARTRLRALETGRSRA